MMEMNETSNIDITVLPDSKDESTIEDSDVRFCYYL